MTSFAQGKIEAFVGSTELGASDDLEAVIVSFIQGAKKSLDIAVQELDNEAIAQAILDAACRGISIRMFTEQDYLRSKRPSMPKQKDGELPEEATCSSVVGAQTTQVSQNQPRYSGITASLWCGCESRPESQDFSPEIYYS